MKIYHGIEEITGAGPCVATVGTFDGFHLGHQSILELMSRVAKKDGFKTTIVTFEPHPRKVLTGQPVQILTTLREKLQIFSEHGIDQVLIIKFTKAFAANSSRGFVKKILVDRLNVQEMVIGHDHHFGRNREGSFENLSRMGEEFGFTAYEAPPFKNGGELINSSKIRHLLKAGDVEKAAKYLGRPYQISGEVYHGDGRGREIGFPTANIALDEPDKLTPAQGVYAIDVSVEKKRYKGMMNIGVRPTFEFDSLTLEAHLFNFGGLLYGKTLTVHFKKFIRNEKKFSSINELKEQLKKDKKISENI